MALVQIPDELYTQVEREAVRQGCSAPDFVRFAIGYFLDRFAEPEPALTEEQLNRMRESMAQVQRGEVVSSEEVDLVFDDFFQRLAARKDAGATEVQEARKTAA